MSLHALAWSKVSNRQLSGQFCRQLSRHFFVGNSVCIPVGVPVQPVHLIIFSAVDHKTIAGHLSDCASKVLTQAVVDHLGIAHYRSSSRLEFLACPSTLTDRSLHQSCFVPSITSAAQLNTQASMVQRTPLLLCWGMLIDSAGVNQISPEDLPLEHILLPCNCCSPGSDTPSHSRISHAGNNAIPSEFRSHATL